MTPARARITAARLRLAVRLLARCDDTDAPTIRPQALPRQPQEHPRQQPLRALRCLRSPAPPDDLSARAPLSIRCPFAALLLPSTADRSAPKAPQKRHSKSTLRAPSTAPRRPRVAPPLASLDTLSLDDREDAPRPLDGPALDTRSPSTPCPAPRDGPAALSPYVAVLLLFCCCSLISLNAFSLRPSAAPPRRPRPAPPHARPLVSLRLRRRARALSCAAPTLDRGGGTLNDTRARASPSPSPLRLDDTRPQLVRQAGEGAQRRDVAATERRQQASKQRHNNGRDRHSAAPSTTAPPPPRAAFLYPSATAPPSPSAAQHPSSLNTQGQTRRPARAALRWTGALASSPRPRRRRGRGPNPACI
jgi:hypothetical protein